MRHSASGIVLAFAVVNACALVGALLYFMTARPPGTLSVQECADIVAPLMTAPAPAAAPSRPQVLL